ncbi:thiamine-phosphate synthase [Alicyclobacillus contaminans]|uniref:thiamine phosphate synthase n=1 Tax=Alicyclobacillus contaminans TaxID=392016 RepID=UPI00040C7B12|nr:thiamine phosphate synthase [Alicyclobacillus contaminans]GMA50658.1 thiamine-phosphate synthase [Alicyclobacillus contaminans]
MTRERWRELQTRLALYVVTDEGNDTERLLRAVREAVAGGATAVQLRRKQEDGRRFVELGHAVRAITREAGALYFVNDRVDIALVTDADGVHIGQSDIPCLDARRLMGDRWIGVSAGSLKEALQAERDGADYLGVGAVFPTTSKDDAEVCGMDVLRDIARAVQIPVVAIGGIQADNAADVVRAGARGVAVVSAVMLAEDPRRAASHLCGVVRAAAPIY